MHIRENVPLAPLTTFEIGGNARYLVEVKTEAEIRDALGYAREHSLAFYVLGGGSNVLVPDEGLDGLVIRIIPGQFGISDDVLEADAGCDLLTLIRSAADAELGGWEKLSGIPGTIGGAARGNAGAFGPEMKDFVTWVHAISTKTEDTHEFSNAECDFAYRMSYFKRNPEWIITRVHVKLQKIKTAESLKLIDETIAEREKRHIQNVRAAGSYFMNPVAPDTVREQFEKEKNTTSREGRVPAGWLIDKAGMRGVCEGGACASEQHPNYLVNIQNATAYDVRILAAKIQDTVLEKFNIQLQEEAVIL